MAETFGAALRRFREAAGLSQAAVAQAAGLHWNMVARLERGERRPSYATACALADALGVGVGEFRGQNGRKKIPKNYPQGD